jgi:hypothetical protein
MAYSIVGLLKRYRADGRYIWHIEQAGLMRLAIANHRKVKKL